MTVTLDDLDPEKYDIQPMPFWWRVKNVPRQTYLLYEKIHEDFPASTTSYWSVFKLVVWGVFHGLPFKLVRR